MKRVLEKYQPVDLSHPLHPSIPTWSGGCGFNLEVKLDYPKGLRVQSLKCYAGVGTHMDAPNHFIEGSWDISEIPLENLIVPLYVIDVREKMDPDLFIQPEDLLAFEKVHGTIQEGSAFFAHTGWSQFWEEPEKYRNIDEKGVMHFPGFSKEAAELLLDRKVVGIGIDTLSPDGANNGPGAEFPVHLAMLRAKKYIIENLAFLEKVPAKCAFVIALPPRSCAATESQARILALVS